MSMQPSGGNERIESVSNPLVKELRSGASFFYNVCGDKVAEDATSSS